VGDGNDGADSSQLASVNKTRNRAAALFNLAIRPPLFPVFDRS
jgi:hypothetical protein